MKAIDLRELADRVNLECVEATSNLSGYPEHITDAITGFSDFTEAETFADEHDLKLVKLMKRQGQDLCTIAGDASREYDVTDFIDDSDYYTHDDLAYVKELLTEKIEEAKDFDELHEIVSDMNDLISAINDSVEGQEIVMKSSNELIDRYVMKVIEDGKEYVIGAVDQDTRVVNIVK